MRKTIKLAIAATMALSAFSVSAQAHRFWVVPSSTVLSGPTPWVTFDAAISNDLFRFEHFPLKVDNVAITGPDGEAIKPENVSQSRLRSSFDLKLEKPGTYRAMVPLNAVVARYTLNGEKKRWRGTAEELEKAIPADAKDIAVTEIYGRVETFVTSGKPSETALKPTGQNLELAPVTHPNHLVQGEEAKFRLLIDGEPAPSVDVLVVRGDARYRNKADEQKLTTNAAGEISVKWTEPGMYWLNASFKDKKAKIKDASRHSIYSATLEVLPK